MKTRLSIIVLCLSLLSMTAFAQLDPGPDGIGLYADMDGMINNVTQDEGMLEVYLLLMGCTEEAGIQAWETGFWFDGALAFGGYQLPYGGFNVATFPDMMVGVSDGVNNDPLPQEPIMHLATLFFFVTGSGEGNIYLKPVSFFEGSGSMGNYLPAYALPGGELRAMYPSSGSVDLPVFTVNGDAPVATTTATMDEIKALYR